MDIERIDINSEIENFVKAGKSYSEFRKVLRLIPLRALKTERWEILDEGDEWIRAYNGEEEIPLPSLMEVKAALHRKPDPDFIECHLYLRSDENIELWIGKTFVCAGGHQHYSFLPMVSAFLNNPVPPINLKAITSTFDGAESNELAPIIEDVRFYIKPIIPKEVTIEYVSVGGELWVSWDGSGWRWFDIDLCNLDTAEVMPLRAYFTSRYSGEEWKKERFTEGIKGKTIKIQEY